MSDDELSTTLLRESSWRVLLRLRWPVGGAVALAFAAGQVVERLLFGGAGDQSRLVLDVIAWGLLGGFAVWLTLTWASRQERRHQSDLEQALDDQRRLNRQMQRTNQHLALLSDVNRHIADSATLDEILSAALAFPQRLIPARAAALVLNDPISPVVARLVGVTTQDLAQLHTVYGLNESIAQSRTLLQLNPLDPDSTSGLCLVLPLHDGQTTLGRIELYLEHVIVLLDDELALLETIASEIAEAITSSRRRTREERALYELERAITEERARIARDIHDGIAQTLAFRRMRVDLWLDWLTSDPERLRGELHDLKQTLRDQIQDLRRAIFALRPVQFDELGFVGGLHRYIMEFASQHDWVMQVDLSGAPPTLSPDLEAISFRVVQEALTNVAKHALATHVAVTITQADQGLQVIVRDNGQGFVFSDDLGIASGHVGLRQMRERLNAIQGRLTIHSEVGVGTEVRAWMPFSSHTQGDVHDQAAVAAR